MTPAERVAAARAATAEQAPPLPAPPPVAPADAASALPAAAVVAPPARTVRRGPLAPLRHRDFALFWSGAFVSNAGTWLQNVALQWVVLDITGSPFWTTMVTFTQFFPMIVFGLLGGLAADRLERRRVLLAAQSILMLVAAALALITFAGRESVATILPVVAAGGVALAFNAPSFQALIPDLVPEDAVLDAVSLNTAQFSASRVIGPLMGGVTLATAGAAWAFFANAVSFLAVIAALLLIRPARQAPPASTGARALFGGVRLLNGSPVIKSIIATTAVVSMFAAPIIALLAVLAKNVLGMGPGGFGGLFAAFSAGAVGGALLTARIVRRIGMWTAVTGGVAVMAACTLVIALSTNVAATSLALAAVGFAYTGTVSATNTGLQVSVPASKRGRVMSIYMMAWAGLYPVGSVLAGVAAEHIGAPATLGLTAIPLALTALALRMRGGVLRTVRV